MAETLKIMIPLFGAMLLPVWIPLIGVSVGAVSDRLRAAAQRTDDQLAS